MSAMDDLRQLANRQPGIATHPAMLDADPIHPWRTPADLPTPVPITTQTHRQPAQIAATAPADPDAGEDMPQAAQDDLRAPHEPDPLAVAEDRIRRAWAERLTAPTTDEPPALPEQTAGPDEAYPADAVELPTAGDPARRVIVNELGNEIAIAVTRDDRGVTVSAVGPTSQVEHTWTPAEADTIRTLLDDTAARPAAADKPDDEQPPAASRWWNRIPWRTR